VKGGRLGVREGRKRLGWLLQPDTLFEGEGFNKIKVPRGANRKKESGALRGR